MYVFSLKILLKEILRTKCGSCSVSGDRFCILKQGKNECKFIRCGNEIINILINLVNFVIFISFQDMESTP